MVQPLLCRPGPNKGHAHCQVHSCESNNQNQNKQKQTNQPKLCPWAFLILVRVFGMMTKCCGFILLNLGFLEAESHVAQLYLKIWFFWFHLLTGAVTDMLHHAWLAVWLHVCLCIVCVFYDHGTHRKIRGQFVGVLSFLLPYEFWELDSGCLSSWGALLLTEPSWPRPQ